MKWAYVKATEGTYYKNPYFAQQYNGSYNVGMIRGAYHFATPDTATGAAQADYFVEQRRRLVPDGRTLPGALDIEYNPYGATCYGKTQCGDGHLDPRLPQPVQGPHRARRGDLHGDQLVDQCTGNYSGFGATNPLWIARYSTTPGTLPAGWGYQTMWQYTSSGPIVGDHDKFNGALDRVVALANG